MSKTNISDTFEIISDTVYEKGKYVYFEEIKEAKAFIEEDYFSSSKETDSPLYGVKGMYLLKDSPEIIVIIKGPNKRHKTDFEWGEFRLSERKFKCYKK